ncbi:hypothetical protein ACEPAI_8215 [Sanghuangporus weigelae]
MTHTSPTTFAVWSVLSFSLGAFLLGHLWRFDKFKCLKWSNAPYSGAFKRIMTYTYLITIPLIMIYSFGFTFIKYKEGFIDVGGTIMPKPYTFWGMGYRDAIFPLMMVFSFAWSFEMVTHLEELCFWYFLITAGPAQPDWFHSPYFRIWILGSIAAVVYVPAVTIVYRDNPLGCEARMFTSGSVGDLVLTLAFIPILFRFPGFIRKVKAEGVDSSIIVRLRKFYELNVIRIVFRFLMQVPLLSLGVDGLKPHGHELNESLFWTDLLSIIAALGCVFSSVCTLLIFFPRSYEAEYHAKELSHRRSVQSMSSRQSHEPQPAYSQYGDDDRHEFEPESISKSASFNTHKFSGNDHYEDDFVKFDRTERRMGTGLVRERLSSKLRERERRIARGTRKMGVELQHVLTRRLMRLSLPRRRHVEPEGSSGISLTPGILSLTHGEQNAKDEKDTVTRRTTPSARSAARQRSESNAAVSEESIGADLKRKGTYLLTNSPVLRARRMYEQEMSGGPVGAVSVETLEAAYDAGAGVGFISGEEHPAVENNEREDTTRFGHGPSAMQSFSDRREISQTQEDGDVPAFALDSPPPSFSVPPYSHATGIENITTAQSHIYGPRPIKKSLSLSTTGTVATRRALPTPPAGDPLGAAPAYSPPQDPLIVPMQIQEQNMKRKENKRAGITVNVATGLRTHPFASASAPLDLQEAALASRPTHMREQIDTPPVTVALQSDMLQTASGRHGLNYTSPHSRLTTANTADHSYGTDLERNVGPLPGGRVLGLTAANLSRLNSSTRASQVNPLVRTFTSPIDFLDRIQESGGSGPDSRGAAANASRTQIGWAV